jgi:hypothetical protein
MSIHSKGTTNGRHDAVVHVGTPSPTDKKDWVRSNVHFHGFADMPEVRGKSVQSPNFFSLGYEWALRLYPRGEGDKESDDEGEEQVSVFLKLCSSTRVKVEFGFAIKDFTIETAGLVEKSGCVHTFECGKESWGYKDFMPRSKCLASLFRGALVIEVRMKPAVNPPLFIPDNPSTCNIIQDLFMDENYADVVFDVSGGVAKSSKSSPARVYEFYAHKLILRKAAPQLAELCMSDGSEMPLHIEIPNMSPDIFKDLLLYIYGRPIPDFGGKIPHTKEIIEAADKYGVTNLKLEAEAYYVALLTITAENVLEHLLFADSMNCALLKEAVMDFILVNSFELLTTKALKGAPSGLFNDVLAATARKGGAEKAGPMFISELRRKCYEEGLDFDGSREMLTSALAGEEEDDKHSKVNCIGARPMVVVIASLVVVVLLRSTSMSSFSPTAIITSCNRTPRNHTRGKCTFDRCPGDASK